ncbi:molybdenum cofactor guanylyltransferase MobA [Roseomonas sp. 18066]|uniref:molybdenum cofactor guanylyltransferase MobA n=1 Tax=Roseomonas sp. 18066 TaxID=2681412 RepID=UPI001F2200AC|nr:molybdenum cofactor guanylyltransferase MobA [Roseomonas sp. 18066]
MTRIPMGKTLGVILAGGLATRMGGGDKPLRRIAGRPMLAHLVERLRPQVDALLLNANGDPARFAAYDLPVAPDPIPGNLGPLVGILAGLDHATEKNFDWVLTCPGDTPFIPPDLATRLHAACRQDSTLVARASSGGQDHPPVALWATSLRDTLRTAINHGERQPRRFADSLGCATVEWDAQPSDPFFNANTPEDLEP